MKHLLFIRLLLNSDYVMYQAKLGEKCQKIVPKKPPIHYINEKLTENTWIGLAI